MASKKRERCERWRAATDAPWLMNVEVDDSTPNAGRLVPVPMAGAACATANGRPRAVLSPGPRPRTDLRLQVSCTNICEGAASMSRSESGLNACGGDVRFTSQLVCVAAVQIFATEPSLCPERHWREHASLWHPAERFNTERLACAACVNVLFGRCRNCGHRGQHAPSRCGLACTVQPCRWSSLVFDRIATSWQLHHGLHPSFKQR